MPRTCQFQRKIILYFDRKFLIILYLSILQIFCRKKKFSLGNQLETRWIDLKAFLVSDCQSRTQYCDITFLHNDISRRKNVSYTRTNPNHLSFLSCILLILWYMYSPSLILFVMAHGCHHTFWRQWILSKWLYVSIFKFKRNDITTL